MNLGNKSSIEALAQSLGFARIVHETQVTLTMDIAHTEAASGAPAGTLIVADTQTLGRGRAGKSWQSAAGDGLWCTLVERPASASGLDVLSLRLGLALANALQPLVDDQVRVKWPNDLFVDARKLSGILVEARWREGTLDWVAVGIGINVRRNAAIDLAALRDGTTREDVLRGIARPIRDACAKIGPLTDTERAEWNARDITVGRDINEPVVGTVRGLANDGALIVDNARGEQMLVRAGSLVFTTPWSARADRL